MMTISTRCGGSRGDTRRARGVGLALAVLLAGTAGVAHGAGLLIADGGLGGVLEVQEHSVRVMINNGVAVTEVTQVFRNTENRQVEALYTFPVPKDASVAGFSMWINGKEMIGEVVEKQRAREIYNSYKQVRRDPGLLEQTDYKTFEMRIFPIGPQAEQKVQICYYQELDIDDDWATYVYPLATTSRTAVDSRTKGKFGLTVEIKSEIPIAAVESPSHKNDFVVAKHTETYHQASMETKGGDLNRDVVLACRLARPRTGIDVVASRRSGEDGTFCLTMTAGEELTEKQTGMDYVFIIDSSGSMADDGKLGLSRGSVEAFIKSLGGEDRFEIVTFNVTANPLFKALQPASDDSRSKADAFLRSQTARGGTVLRPAIATAFQYGNPDRTLNVVILSDGMAEQEERATLLEMSRSRPRNARIFCVGVGNDVNRPLLEQLAEDAGGLASFVSAGDDFDRQAKAFRRKLMRPVATNLEIKVEGGDVYDVEPTRLPNLFHGSPVRMYGRYRGSGTVKVNVKGEIAGAEMTKSVEATLPAKEDGNPEIERMWAWHKVQRLLKEGERAGQPTQGVPEIVRLGEAYSIATQYTSFIVLENDGEYQRWKIERKNALRLERDRKPRQQLLAQLETMRAKTATGAGPISADAEPAAPNPINNAKQVVSAQPPTNAPARPGDLNLSPRGGGPVGPFGVVGVGALALLEWRRRRKAQEGGK